MKQDIKNTDKSGELIELSSQQLKLLAIHESAHAVVITLLHNYLQISQVAILIEKTSYGYRLGTNQITGSSGNNASKTAVGIAVLAGVVGQYIHENGIEKIKVNKEAILENLNLLDWHWASGDCKFFLDTATVLDSFFQIDIIKFKKYCISFLIDFLADEENWQIVEKISEKLLSASDRKLTEPQLDEFYRSCGYDVIVNAKADEVQTILDGMEQACGRELNFAKESTDVDLFGIKSKNAEPLGDATTLDENDAVKSSTGEMK